MNPLIHRTLQFLYRLLGSRLNQALSRDWEDACGSIDYMEISYEHPDIRVSVYFGKEEKEHQVPKEILIYPDTLCSLLSSLLGISFTSTLDSDSGDFTLRMDGLEVHFLHLLLPYGIIMMETEEGMFKESVVDRLCGNARKEFSLT